MQTKKIKGQGTCLMVKPKKFSIPILKNPVRAEEPKPNQERDKKDAANSMFNHLVKPKNIKGMFSQVGLGQNNSAEKKGRGAAMVKKLQQETEKRSSNVRVSNGSSEIHHPQRPEGLKEGCSPIRGKKEFEKGSLQSASKSADKISHENLSTAQRGQKRPLQLEKVGGSIQPRVLTDAFSRENQQREHIWQPGPVTKGPFKKYGSCSRKSAITTPPRRRTPIEKWIVNKRNKEEPVDLTGDSDDEGGASHAPSRADLIDVTGSSSTGVDSSDVCPAQDSIDLDCDDAEEVSGQECEFFETWVGSDEELKRICSTGVKDEPAESSELSTVRAPGMGSFSLDPSTLRCLANSTWLNDEVVNAYMALLSLRTALSLEAESEDENDNDNEENCKSGGLRCEYFSSFFYALLRNAKGGYSHENVKRWALKKNLSDCDRIFFPINVSNSHWCLAVVFPKEKTIRYYDSLGGTNSNCLQLLERYMQDEGAMREDDDLQGEWKKKNVGPPEVPRQQDGSSCGVFLCAFADRLSAGREPTGFSQHNIKSMRKAVRKFLQQCRM